MSDNMKDHLKKIISMNWTETEFGPSKLKADYKKNLSKILQLDSFNNIQHDKEKVFIPDDKVMYIADRNGKEIKFISATVSEDKVTKTVKVKYDSIFPPFGKLVVDYLIGRYVFHDDKLYDVNNKQAKLVDEITLSSLYGFKHGSDYVLEILKGIDLNCHVEPVRKLEPHQIAGNDFIIDLETHTITRKVINNEISYFKFYPVDYEKAKASKTIANKFLNYVIDDPDSLHNAQLQAYYIAQVASGLKSKTNFFISKSGVRTGKGLRHTALAGLFNKIDVELDNLVSRGFDGLNAWAMFSGGEMALATEQGDIVGDKVERVLKIIATEKTHVARNVGGNQGLVHLTSVLCIDTNRNVSLSDEMNGRKILIQYKDRPEGESDLEREQAFEEYWQAFTKQDKEPNVEGCIGFLMASLDYFNQQGNKFIWKDVEVYNGDEALDDFQVFLIDDLEKHEFVPKDYSYRELALKLYGKNNYLLSKALQTIGVSSKRMRLEGDLCTVYYVSNPRRFKAFGVKYEKPTEPVKPDMNVLKMLDMFDELG